MAILTIPDEDLVLREESAIGARLQAVGVTYERWALRPGLGDGTPAEVVLAAYEQQIETLKRRGGYVTADVIDVGPDTPGLDDMLARFQSEHWHDEDEVRFVVAGRGLFHIRPGSGPVVAVETGPGDLLAVPRGTRHWFHLCRERRIRAIRLFQDPAGWSPHYTRSGVDTGYEPLCLGPAPVPTP